MPEIELAYAGKTGTIKFPEQMNVEIVAPNTLPIVLDATAAIEQAVKNPIGCRRLKDSVRPGQAVAIMVTDITRKIPDGTIVQVLLNELHEAGIEDRDVKIIIATGLHRPNTPEEIAEMLGPEIPARVEVVNHVAKDKTQIVYLGKTKRGLPMSINRHVAEADVRIATGVIEPHKLAGYSGGVKTMAVGAAGEETIAATHNIEVSEHPTCRLGIIENNIFREFLTEVAMTVNLHFIVNVVQNSEGKLVRVVAGHAEKAFEQGVQTARKQSEVSISGPADLVVAVPGYPKDRDVYQASRAMNSVIFGPEPVVNQGGAVIVPAPCQDGFGHRGVYDYLAGAASPQELVERVKREGYPIGGAPVAYKIATILLRADVYYTDCVIERGVLERMHLRWAPTLQVAIDDVMARKHPQTALVMPFATATLPVLAGGGI